ncbi:unnamed protein product [Litomosoides sigmodontis]|uniref:C2H2-type domain-containing protein n=1 Tax=Litomosoides sigmodontis TaxID=42156 RepID=A0A3P6TR72_LITSI|nr:unnamed protein product [Litomosoides sigmodontis]
MTEAQGHHHRIRKRHRGEIANPANTLDGLVAKRADDVGARDSLHNRYLTEAEAIEAPTDDQEMKISFSPQQFRVMWINPEIKFPYFIFPMRYTPNNYYSALKWILTCQQGPAPFVAIAEKSHGIRVVSKYSRSKTFHNSTSTLNRTESQEEKGQMSTIGKDVGLRCRKSKTVRLPLMYRCVICMFEQDSVLVLMSHLKNAHNALPYECHSCGSSFIDAHTTMKHFTEKTACRRTDLKINIAPPNITRNNFNVKPSLALLDEAARRAAQELFGKSSAITSTLPTTSSSRFEAEDPSTVDDSGNEIIHNCVFCNWTARKMCAVEEHMRMHIINPSLLMEPIDEIVANSPATQMKVSTNSTAMAEQALAISRYFDFRALLSVLKQQATFDSVHSMRTLTSMPTLLSEWLLRGPSAFKQVAAIPEENTPVARFTSYSGVYDIQQKKSTQQLNCLFPNTADANISCNSVTLTSNFDPDGRSDNFYHVNSISCDVPEESSVSVSSTPPNHLISESVIKAVQYCCKRHDALFSSIPVTEDKIQKLIGLPDLPKDETSQRNQPEVAHRLNMRKEDDDFVDVVQLDG